MCQLRGRPKAHPRAHQGGKGRGQARVEYENAVNVPLLFLVPPKDISAILTTLVRHSSTQNLDSDAKILPFNRRDLLWIGLIIVAASWTFFQSYQKWLDPIIDVGRDLYIPGELPNGEKLYRDILYIYPPLTPYLLSSITWMFGSRLPVYIVLGVMVPLS